MQIPRSLVDEYTRQVNLISGRLQEALRGELRRIDWSNWAAAKAQAVRIMQSYGIAASDAIAVVGVEFYTIVRRLAGVGGEFTPVYDGGYVPEATERAVSDFFDTEGATPESVASKCEQRLGYVARRAASESVMNNGAADRAKPRYARVPSGAETCMFCLMLASRGFVYHNERSAGGLDHWHDNCDCRIVPGFPGSTEVEGYDPGEIYGRWSDEVDAEAEARAERSGRPVSEERKAIVRSLQPKRRKR